MLLRHSPALGDAASSAVYSQFRIRVKGAQTFARVTSMEGLPVSWSDRVFYFKPEVNDSYDQLRQGQDAAPPLAAWMQPVHQELSAFLPPQLQLLGAKEARSSCLPALVYSLLLTGPSG